MEWKRYPEDKDELNQRSRYVVKGRIASTDLSELIVHRDLVQWNGHEFGTRSLDMRTNQYSWEGINKLVEEYLEIE